MDIIVHNILAAYGPTKAALVALTQRMAGDGWLDRLSPQALTFQNIRPMPKDLPPDDWGTWAVENWGTKWDAVFGDDLGPGSFRRFEPGERSRYFHSVEYDEFQTAGNAPTPLFDDLAAQYPGLSFWCHSRSVDGAFGHVWSSDLGHSILARRRRAAVKSIEAARRSHERIIDATHELKLRAQLSHSFDGRMPRRGGSDAPRQTPEFEILVHSVPAESPHVHPVIAYH
jgi:hypothetical protein